MALFVIKLGGHIFSVEQYSRGQMRRLQTYHVDGQEVSVDTYLKAIDAAGAGHLK